MRSGREAHDQHTRIGIAKARYRLAPVFAIPVSAPLFTSNLFAIFDQAWAPRARDDFMIENGKPGHEVITPYPS